ncbi:unnamed protein product [Rhizoctonia solani]|uniref:Uncharacterized protein n=1 Tax=Rhizoctonia solani TaxID=456999 RepID=A0A8H2WFY6_9AGAM|nr:unnamed protein product [Rhizoctonia solani]
MSPLMKSLYQVHGEHPIAPPKLGRDFHELRNEGNIIPETESLARQRPPMVCPPSQPGPNPPLIFGSALANTVPDATNSFRLRHQTLPAVDETMELLSEAHVQGQVMNYEILDGVSLGRLMLGAMIATAPGVQTASAIHTTAGLCIKGLCGAVQSTAHFSGTFRSVRVGRMEEEISGGWIVITSQDVHDAERAST